MPRAAVTSGRPGAQRDTMTDGESDAQTTSAELENHHPGRPVEGRVVQSTVDPGPSRTHASWTPVSQRPRLTAGDPEQDRRQEQQLGPARRLTVRRVPGGRRRESRGGPSTPLSSAGLDGGTGPHRWCGSVRIFSSRCSPAARAPTSQLFGVRLPSRSPARGSASSPRPIRASRCERRRCRRSRGF